MYYLLLVQVQLPAEDILCDPVKRPDHDQTQNRAEHERAVDQKRGLFRFRDTETDDYKEKDADDFNDDVNSHVRADGPQNPVFSEQMSNGDGREEH